MHAHVARLVTLVSPYRPDVLEIGQPVTVEGGVRFIWTYFQHGREIGKGAYNQDFDGRISAAGVKVRHELTLFGVFKLASEVALLRETISDLEAAKEGS